MNTDAIESMVRDVLSRMNSLQGEAPTAAPAADGTSRSAKVSDYPLANKHPEVNAFMEFFDRSTRGLIR